MVVQMTYLPLPLLFLLLFPISSALSPLDGFNSIRDLNSEMETHFARENSLSLEEFQSRLPSQQELTAIRKLISLIFIQKNQRICNPFTVEDSFPILNGTITLSSFQTVYCVIHEPIPKEPNQLFPRTFGFVIIRILSSEVVDIHHSSPHFESDGGVNEQAATLFEMTKSRSLVNNGISRFAVRGNPDSTCQPGNTLADAAHNINLAFHAMLQGIYDSTKSVSGNHYIQWHGMSQTSCAQSTAFISLGANGKNEIYQSSNVADKLARAITQCSNGKVVGNTPRDDSQCNLVAGTNVFGRQVHGVEEKEVCAIGAKNFDQRFIHIEQKVESRTEFESWREALNRVFRPIVVHEELKI
ncbi:hypothetical protein PFISCL1PPCAC_14883 [Pristionchus fissidentatus]|uniref:Uncharacterized protein n=1 Tax=Pristionchus fissidentatus TaxID=1538716 RepID=A0AAV5VYK5_9BILA|nr:hypothetical protein PFISCL1PPCAC_14883 [Pristionchus fissidentatus]